MSFIYCCQVKLRCQSNSTRSDGCAVTCSLMQCPRMFVELGWRHSCIFCSFSIWGLFFTLHSCCCFSLVIPFLYFKLGLDAAPRFIGFSSCPFWVRLLFKHLVGRSSLLQLCAETMAYACKVISRTNFWTNKVLYCDTVRCRWRVHCNWQLAFVVCLYCSLRCWTHGLCPPAATCSQRGPSNRRHAAGWHLWCPEWARQGQIYRSHQGETDCCQIRWQTWTSITRNRPEPAHCWCASFLHRARFPTLSRTSSRWSDSMKSSSGCMTPLWKMKNTQDTS